MCWKAQPIVNRDLVVLCNVVWSNCPANTAFSGVIQQTYNLFDKPMITCWSDRNFEIRKISGFPASPVVSFHKSSKTLKSYRVLGGCHIQELHVGYTGITKSGKYQAFQPVLLFHKSSKTLKSHGGLGSYHIRKLHVGHTGITKSGKYQAYQPVLSFHESSKTIK